MAPFFLVVGAIRAARVNVGDAVWQKRMSCSIRCLTLVIPRCCAGATCMLCALCACSAGERGGEQAFALQRIGIEPNGEWAVIDELDLHHRAE